ncbi:MAG TPA: hypothetical protein VG651_10000 [Stellaceae bacterium]|nr:hypothetical protein [Stellaceae bacterium]
MIVVAVIAATPYWAPPVMHALPWGTSENTAEPAKQAPQPEPAKTAQTLAAAPAPDPAIAALKAEAGQNAAALQQLAQRVAALEAKPAPPAPDLAPIEQQLGALGKTTGDLEQSVAALDKAVRAQPAGDPKNTACALVLLQIREAVDTGRPFAAEYQALLGLTRDNRDLAAAAASLAGAADTGVASRAVLAARLRQLAPQIAAARTPPSGWKAEIVARLRALVTIRRVAGGGQSPAEAAVGAAQHDIAAGDLAGAVAALDKLDGAHRAAADPWLKMAQDRLAVEAALRRARAVLAATVGGAAPAGKS